MTTTPQSGRSAIESIVRELEKIPEPIQLSLLDFIRSLSISYSATNQPEASAMGNNASNPSRKRRTTSTLIAGKGKTLGDIVSPKYMKRDYPVSIACSHCILKLAIDYYLLDARRG
jgi:hypothetical protein